MSEKEASCECSILLLQASVAAHAHCVQGSRSCFVLGRVVGGCHVLRLELFSLVEHFPHMLSSMGNQLSGKVQTRNALAAKPR